MKRSLVVVFMLLALSFMAFGSVQAEVRPINLCLWDTVQLFPKSDTINGLRLSIYGVNDEAAGVDIGIVPRITGNFIGAQWGVVNIVDKDFTGYQEAFVNLVKGDFLGWQAGAINITNGQIRGLQSALVNKAGDVRGVQFAFVNITESLYGLQVGLINVNNTPNPFKVFPIVNWSF